MFPEYCMALLPFGLNTGTYAANLRTFGWPHRENQIFTMWPSKAKFPAGARPGRPLTWPPWSETRAEGAFENNPHACRWGQGQAARKCRRQRQGASKKRSSPPRGGRPRNSARTSRGHRHRLHLRLMSTLVSYIHTYTHTYTPETHCWCSRW